MKVAQRETLGPGRADVGASPVSMTKPSKSSVFQACMIGLLDQTRPSPEGKKPGSRGRAPGGVWGEAPRTGRIGRNRPAAAGGYRTAVPRIHSASRSGPSMSHSSGGSRRDTALLPSTTISAQANGTSACDARHDASLSVRLAGRDVCVATRIASFNAGRLGRHKTERFLFP